MPEKQQSVPAEVDTGAVSITPDPVDEKVTGQARTDLYLDQLSQEEARLATVAQTDDQTDGMTRTDLYLGQAYHARNRGGATVALVEQAFQSLIEADETFRAEAAAKLVTLTPAICQRDHVSRVYYDVLTRMLND